MIGAIIGDIVGARYERRNHKSKDFELFDNNCRPTDDMSDDLLTKICTK